MAFCFVPTLTRAESRENIESFLALIRAPKDPDVQVRHFAATELGRFGVAAAAAVPDLEKALQDENIVVRDAAAEALDSISRAALRQKLP